MNPLYILGVPLGYVMEWIYKLIPNYGWDIILFTLLINIVKTPPAQPAEKHRPDVGIPADDRGHPEKSTRISPKSRMKRS